MATAPTNESQNGTLRPGRKIPISIAIASFVWLGIIVAVTVLMFAYAGTPGDGSTPPRVWPDSSGVSQDHSRPTLVLFLHPHCPCSHSTISELALLMAQAQGKVNVRALFLRPPGMSAQWVETSSWREAAAIPGVTVQPDDDGSEALRFGMKTSGDAALYSADGRLLFHGGITISRNHAGDNPGRDALRALLNHESTPVTKTPVFGCALFEPGTNHPASITCRKEASQP